MKNIEQISFPRSGTQLLQFLLLTYLSGNLYFPTDTKEKKRLLLQHFLKNNKINTEYYSLEKCLQEYINSSDRKVYSYGVFTFSHYEYHTDECNYIYYHQKPDLEVKDNTFYIVQYRHPLLASLSLLNYNISDDGIKEIAKLFEDWRIFVNSMVLNNLFFNNNVCYIKYMDFINDPKKYMIKIIQGIEVEL